MSFSRAFKTNMPAELDETEPELTVWYEFFPAEPPSRHYPGCRAGATIIDVAVEGRALMAAEELALMSGKNLKWLESEAFDDAVMAEGQAIEWAEERKFQEWKEDARRRLGPTFATAPDIFAERKVLS